MFCPNCNREGSMAACVIHEDHRLIQTLKCTGCSYTTPIPSFTSVLQGPKAPPVPPPPYQPSSLQSGFNPVRPTTAISSPPVLSAEDPSLIERTLRDKFPSLTFQVSCFRSPAEIETKCLAGWDGLPVCDEMILIRDRVKEVDTFYAVYLYSNRYVSYRSLLEQLEEKISLTKDNTDCLKKVEEKSWRTNLDSLRVFDLIWEKKKERKQIVPHDPVRN